MPIQRWIPSMWLMCLASIVDIMSFIFSSWDCSHKQDFPWNSKDLLTTLCSKINTRDVSKGDHVLFVDVNLLWIRYRNIIQIHSNVPWDWQHSTKYSPHLDWTWGILCRILSIPRNIVMYVNNVMKISITYATKFPLPFWRANPFNTVLNVVASGQDRSPQMSFILKGSQKLALQLNVWFKSKTLIQEYDIQNSYWTCARFIRYMLSVQCEEPRSNHLTPLLVVTMPYACWFLWRVDDIEDFKWWCLHFSI